MPEENLVIHKIFSEVAGQFPDKVALQIKKDNQWERVTYRGLDLRSLKVAAFLIKEGFKKGDFAALILENRPEWPTIYLGIIRAGLTCVPLDPGLSPQEIRNLIADSGLKVIFCSQEIFVNKVKPTIEAKSAKFVILDNKETRSENLFDFCDIQNIFLDHINYPLVSAEDIASLIYTSGTTAKPKGVMLSHKNIASDAKNIQKLDIYYPGDNILSILPLHHTYSFMVTLILPLFVGGKITYCSGFKSQELIGVIHEAAVTMLVGVPQLYLMLYKGISDRLKKIPFLLRMPLLPFIKIKLRTKLGSLRFLVSGGARLEPKVASELSKWLGIKLIEGYGLTETSPVVTLNPPRKIKFGSVGKPIPGVQIKILDPDTSGVGQVLIRGANVMQGYFRRQDLTDQVIRDEWFYSGDLGYIDRDGYLYLTGREKDVIVLSSGKNIYPEELQGHYSHSQYIKEICILSRKEEKFGSLTESLYAVIVPNLDYFSQKNEADIRGKIRWELENLAKDLPSYQHIMGFSVIKEELPRTALKKIKRYEVREKYLEARASPQVPSEIISAPEDLGTLNKELARKIMGYISGQLKHPVSLDNHLEIDLGIDSLTRVELGLGLEAILKLKIPDTALYKASTVRDVIVNIQNLLEAPSSAMLQTETIQKTWSQILKESPQGLVLKRIRINAGFLDILVTLILKSTLFILFKTCWLLKIKGKVSLPKKGPYLICPNHASYLDGFVVFSSLTFKIAISTFFIGYSDIFQHTSIAWGNKLARLIPIDPSTHLTEAMQAVSFILSQGKIACIFPEGRRSIDENVGGFKKGVGILIKELDIPVVPVYIKGSHYSWPRGNRFPRFYPLRLTFGKPVSLAELSKDRSSGSGADDYEAIAQALRKEVLKLAC